MRADLLTAKGPGVYVELCLAKKACFCFRTFLVAGWTTGGEAALRLWERLERAGDDMVDIVTREKQSCSPSTICPTVKPEGGDCLALLSGALGCLLRNGVRGRLQRG